MKNITRLGSLFVVLTVLNACSVVKAYNQPDAKNMGLLRAGMQRADLVAEFGQPVLAAQTKNKEKYEVFSFVDGYSKNDRTLRAVLHGLADVSTLGLWEVAGGPIEQHYDGTQMLVRVTYDSADTVARVAELKRQ